MAIGKLLQWLYCLDFVDAVGNMQKTDFVLCQ